MFKLTRDSALWWLLLVCSVATFLTGHFELLTNAFPSLSPVWQSRIELVGGLGALVATYLRMSPLALSPTNEVGHQGADASKTLTITGKNPEETS